MPSLVLRDIAVTTLANVIALVLIDHRTSELVHSLWRRWKIWRERIAYFKQYNDYFKGILRGKPRMLLLCHGRDHGVPEFTFESETTIALKIEDFDVITMDKNKTTNPHIVQDLKNPNVELGFFHWIVWFNCHCHTQDLNSNDIFFEQCKKWLAPGGHLIVTQPESIGKTSHFFHYFIKQGETTTVIKHPVPTWANMNNLESYSQHMISYSKPFSSQRFNGARYVVNETGIVSQDVEPTAETKQPPLLANAQSDVVTLLKQIQAQIQTFVLGQEQQTMILDGPNVTTVQFSEEINL
jgi:hypothetical protein